MSAADVDELVDELTGFDMDEKPPCGARDCDAPATWRATVLCPISRHAWLFCDEHRRREVAGLALPGPNVCALHLDTLLSAPYLEWRHL